MIRTTAGGVDLEVRVIPRSGRTGFGGVRDGALLVRLHAPPVEGAANEELVEVVADLLGVPKRAVTLVSGERSRRKRVHVAGVSEEGVRAALGAGHR